MIAKIKSLEERIAERKQAFDNMIRSEKLFQGIYDSILPLLPEESSSSASIYEFSSYLYISVPDVEVFELNYLSKLSDLLNTKWTREICETNIEHKTIVRLSLNNIDYELYINISAKPTGSCVIRKIITGRIKKETRITTVDVPEIEYLIECSDDEESTKEQ